MSFSLKKQGNLLTPNHNQEPHSRASSRGRSGRSQLSSRELGGSIDLDIQTGVLPLLSENPAYRDWETSDTSLRFLEEKVRKDKNGLLCVS